MLAEYATASLKAGRPLLQRSPRLGQPSPSWTRRIKPLTEPWLPAESYRTVRESMRKLTVSETPVELADMNIYIRERSLATT